MAYEILKSIVEAEGQAAQIRQQAAKQAEEMKAKALKQQTALLEEAKRSGAEKMQTAVDQALEESRAAICGMSPAGG